MADFSPSPEQVCEHMPQRRPFKFVDRYLEVSESHAVSVYTFRDDEFFYAGHFPDRPVTPAVILFETMSQAAQGISYFRMAREQITLDVRCHVLFTDGSLEVFAQVPPGTMVVSRAKLVFCRREKLRADVKMFTADGTLVASSLTSGIGIRSATG